MSAQPRDVLEEVTTDDLAPDHVRRRLDDWERRINDLYDSVESWLPSHYVSDRSERTFMNEDVMERVGLPGRQLPILSITRGGEPVLRIQPYALWIIGGNGRLKAYGPHSYANIVDRASMFEPPRWEIAIGADRFDTKPLTAGEFLKLV